MSMKQIRLHTHQSGVALIVSLLLLFVMILLGVASFSNSHVQERSANNIRLQALAFEAASAGASNAIDFVTSYADHTYVGGGGPPDDLCGEYDHPGWIDADGNPVPTGWVDMGTVGNAQLHQRMYCIADEYPDTGLRPARSQLFVHSRGSVLSGTTPIAQRDVEVRVSLAKTESVVEGCGALCFPHCDFKEEDPGLVFPRSSSFTVDGNGGPAVTTGCDPFTYAIDEAIKDQAIGNYDGGIETMEIAPPPWDDASETAAFRDQAIAAAQAAEAIEGECQGFCYRLGDYLVTPSESQTFGTVADPQITVIDGNADIRGTIEGAGILVITGELIWKGTIEWKGLVLNLGGNIAIDGGGNGGVDGTVIALNLLDDDTFGEVGFQNQGGGTADYFYDCAMVSMARDLFSGILTAQQTNPWTPRDECDPNKIITANETELIVKSWRENIGWREEQLN
jgi:hypothetical protein